MKIPLKRYWGLLRQYLTPQWRRVSLLSVLILTSIGLKVLNPQLIRHFLDSATNGDTLPQLLVAAVLFLIFALIRDSVCGRSIWVKTSAGQPPMRYAPT